MGWANGLCLTLRAYPLLAVLYIIRDARKRQRPFIPYRKINDCKPGASMVGKDLK